MPLSMYCVNILTSLHKTDFRLEICLESLNEEEIGLSTRTQLF
jgi:hypothetical protein